MAKATIERIKNERYIRDIVNSICPADAEFKGVWDILEAHGCDATDMLFIGVSNEKLADCAQGIRCLRARMR